MSTLIHADIFFFVATIAVALLTILIVILLIYLFRIASNVRHFTDRLRTEGDFVLDEAHEMALRMKVRRFGFKAIFRFVRSLIRRYY